MLSAPPPGATVLERMSILRLFWQGEKKQNRSLTYWKQDMENPGNIRNFVSF